MIIFSQNWDWVMSIVNTNFVCNNFLALKWVTHQLPFWHLTNSLLSFRLRDFQCTNHSHSNEQELKIKIIMFFCSWTIQKLATAATKKKEFASTNLPKKKKCSIPLSYLAQDEEHDQAKSPPLELHVLCQFHGKCRSCNAIKLF